MKEELKEIKKKYGEEMSHFCRDQFATLLETEGLLSSFLFEHFDVSHELYKDLKNNNLLSIFVQYIYSFIEEKQDFKNVDKTPQELLDSVGYKLYECKTEGDIQKFKKYYAKGEELCTFHGGRLATCYVFFAVKKNVNQIKRKNFSYPQRQDEYGTSVISIQFSKNTNQLSIKNRYNHTVDNPDSTFGNNLDNIADGLTDSFQRIYGLKQKEIQKFEIPGYVMMYGKYYKYNYEIDNNYYCTNNIFIKNNQVLTYPKERYILFDYFLLDLKEKKIDCLVEYQEDSFIKSIGKIESVKIEKENEFKKIIIKNEHESIIEIVLNHQNQIIKYRNEDVKEIENDFCFHNKTIEELFLPNVEKIGDYFCYWNEIMTKFEAFKLKEIGDSFCNKNESCKELNLPSVQTIGDNFLRFNKSLEALSLPSVVMIGDCFCFGNQALKSFEAPCLEYIGKNFCYGNHLIENITLPNAKAIGEKFCYQNIDLRKIYLPSVEVIEDDFCYINTCIEELFLPNIQNIGSNFCFFNNSLKKISLPNVTYIDSTFCYKNEVLESFEAPNLKSVENNFLYCNQNLKTLNLPSVTRIGYGFFGGSKSLSEISLPKVENIGDLFCNDNTALTELDLPNVKEIGHYFCFENSSLVRFEAPNLEYIGDAFLKNNFYLKILIMPKTRNIETELDLLYERIPVDTLILKEEVMSKDYPLIMEYQKRKLEEEIKKRNQEQKLKKVK